VPEKDPQLTGVPLEQLTHLLSNLVHENLVQSANQHEIELSNDSVISLSLSKAALVPRLTFSLVTIGFAILIGISATFLRAWYF
jgi:hypothetical protein